jgi:TonB-linked SusC/RagA family outer membrane protein
MRKCLLLGLAMLITAGMAAYGQDRTISGKVISAEDGSPLPGVNVVVKGTTTGAVTDIDGNYKFSIPAEGGILVFSFIGLVTQEIEIGSRSVIDLTMTSDVEQLAEVVVTGYSTTTQQKNIAAVSVVGAADIEDVPLPDVNQLLQGKAAGVYTTAPSGQPGAAQDIRIRGTGSISAGRGPLYVIDGIIAEQGDFTSVTQTNDVLSNINPNDIESLTVLKDASATALYGSRGSNGVILITTKRGKVGKSTITARAQYGVVLKNTGNFDMMDAQTVWDYERQIMVNSGISPADIDLRRPASMLDSTFNWVDAAFKQGSTANYELQASGGSENTRYFVSASVFSQDGTLIESNFKRFSVRSNIDQTLSEKWELGLNLNVSYTDQLNATAGNRFASPLLGAFVNSPLQSPINPETGELYTGQENEFNIFTGDNFLYSAPLNPVINNNLRTLGKLNLQYNILDNLNISQVVALDFVSIREGRFFDPTTNDGANDNGSIDEFYNQNITLTSQTKAAGNWTIGDKHNLDALAVFEVQNTTRENFGATGIGLATGKLKTLNSTATPQDVSGFFTDFSFVSLLAQANYNYDNRYYFSGSVRNDASSRFGANNRNATFWSVGASWRIIEESFMSGASWLNDLKLRSSYGTSGNANIGNFASRGLYAFGAAYLGQPGSAPSQIDNPDLTWEVSASLNVGLDVSVLNSRVNISGEYYNRISSDLLLDVPISSTSGFTTATRNIGEVKNTGVELVLNTVNFDGEFLWTTDFNISWNNNEVLALNNDEDIINPPGNFRKIYRVGESMGSWYIEEWAGVNPADGTPLWMQTDEDENPTTTTGSFSLAGRRIVGDAIPDFTGGITNTMSYKGISLSFFFNFVYGNKVFNSSRRFIESDGQRFGWNHLAEAGQDYWQNPGDIASRPQPLLGGNNSSNSASTRYLEDGSYLRLRNVTLGYSFPQAWMDKAGMQKLRIYVQGVNLWTLTNYSGFDPEMDETGSEFFRYPVGKTISVGLDLTF